MALGALISAYFGYVWASAGTAAAGSSFPGGRFPANRTFNQSNSGFNQSRFNSTRIARSGRLGFARSPISYIEGIVIGVLVLLLGLMSFKYANLKASVGRK